MNPVDVLRMQLRGSCALVEEHAANSSARWLKRDDVVKYAQALRSNIDAWLNTLDATELERIPRLREVNQAHPRYATEAAWEEIKGLEGIPAWQLLMRPCGSHIRMHMGELETLLQVPA